MASERLQTSRLFATSVIEGRTDLDERFDRSYNHVTNLTRNLSETEAHDVLNRALNDRQIHEDIYIGLLVSILSDPPNASKHYHDLTLISRDSLKCVTDSMIQIVGERYSRLTDTSRVQLLWLVREMVNTGVNNAEGVVWNLLRQIAGGDISTKNVWLAETLVDILRDHRSWLDRFSVIVASVAYTYLRVLEDHQGPDLANLRQKEVNFVLGLLKERFQDCMKVGRDLVRVLQNIARIPEIEQFWKELLHNPTSLSPGFTGILQLLQTRTSRRFFVVRLTPEMEKKMFFLCTDVKFGTQKRYQEWFQRQYLNTPESQTLRCDLIRFIIGCIHPSNEVLCSDIIPRWAVIGWLLSSCTSPVATANAKLSLFFDWLFYNTDTDNIMNIEPGILVMYHSLRPHPVLTTSLLDFLCRIIPNFHPSLTDKVKLGVQNSLTQILEKRVVQSLDPLFDHPRMDVELRKLVRDTFPDFCATSASTAGPFSDLKHEDFVGPVSGSHSSIATKMDLIAETGLDFGSAADLLGPGSDGEPCPVGEDDAAFSEEDDEESKLHINTGSSKQQNPPAVPPVPPAPPNSHIPNPRIKSEALNDLNSVPFTNSTPISRMTSYSHNDSTSTKSEPGDAYSLDMNFKSRTNPEPNGRSGIEPNGPERQAEFNRHLDFLEKDVKNLLEDMLLEKDHNSRCNVIQKICDLIFSEDLDSEEAQHLAACLAFLLNPEMEFDIEESILPSKITTESLDQSLNRPLYTLFDNLVTLTEDDHRRQSFLFLLSEFHKMCPTLGYHFLYFLKANTMRKEKEEQESNSTMQIYRDLCKASGQKDLSAFLLRDIQMCCERDPRLISWVVPSLYQTFPKQTVGNVELLRLILERLDSSQLHDLVCMVLQGSLQLFDNNSFSNILEKSLHWETVEQIFLWQLARAHEIPVDCCLSVLPKLKFCSHTDSVMSTHGEALSNILMMLRRESPSERLLKHLFARELKPSDPTVTTILQYWVQRYEDKMAKLVNDMVNCKHQPQPSPNKRKRNQGSSKASGGSSSSSLVPAEQILSHLNQLRIACEPTKFFALSTMQEALLAAQSGCSESQKRRYSDLFALIDEEERESSPPENTKKAKAGRGRRHKSRIKQQESESEEESSEEEDVKKPSRKKIRNKLGSDSE